MPELTDEEATLWATHQPGKPIPGNPEPVDGKCNALLNGQNKGLRELGIQTERYCGRDAGWGTDHKGQGCCKYHLGNAPKHEIAAVRAYVLDKLEKRRALMENPPPLRHWTVELELEARRAKAWASLIDSELLNRTDLFTITQTGKEEEIALIVTAREAHKDFTELVKFVSKMDLANKKLELQQEQARAIAAVVLGVCLDSSLSLTDEQVEKIRALLKEALVKITATLQKNFDFDADWSEEEGTSD